MKWAGVLHLLGKFCARRAPKTNRSSASYPTGWGASPDGLIVDPHMTWDQVPADISKHYTEAERASFNITRGACEFKTSRTKLSMEAYFYPQVYLEMIVLNVVWCDLIRYRPGYNYSDEHKTWVHEDTAHVYRIYRHRPTEDLLLQLWKYAFSNVSKLQDIIVEDSFVQLRAFFTTLANQIPIRKAIGMTPEINQQLVEYHSRKRKLMTPENPDNPPTDAQEKSWMSSLQESLLVLVQTDPKKQKQDAVRLLANHMQECASILKHII
jgi:hypothetical protein